MVRKLWLLFRKENQGISLVEIVLILAVSAFLFTALASLLLRTSSTKLANENFLAASTLAEDVLERVRKKSIDNFDNLATLIGNNNTLEISFNSSVFVTQFYPPPEFLPPIVDKLPGVKDSSSILFRALQRNSVNNRVEKISVKVIIKWQEPTGWKKHEAGEGTIRMVQGKEYVLQMNIAKSGLRAFLEEGP